MSDEKIDFDFTIEDLDRMVIEAARGEEGEVKNKVKVKKPNLLNRMQLGNKLSSLNPRKRE